MKFKCLFAILFAGLFFWSCKKDVEIPKIPKLLNVSAEIKEWAYFKPGTYWIMRDSATAALDSVYVTTTSTSNITLSNSKDSVFLAEIITVLINSSSGYFYGFILDARMGNSVRSFAEYPGAVPVFNFDTSHVSVTYGDGINNYKQFNSYRVLSTTYSDVRYISYAYELYGHSHGQYWLESANFWKKNIGIIKKYGYTPNPSASTYELLRCHIVQ